MIPALNIVAWGNVVPWADQRQIEQDLIISRAIVEIFSDPLLGEALRFRGGTALNKLHFAAPLRYSADIDLVRTAAGPIGPVLDGIRRVLEPWLGRAQFDQSPVAPKLRFRVDAEDPAATAPIRLKVEINTREIVALGGPLAIPFAIENPWFSGSADIPTFSRDETFTTLPMRLTPLWVSTPGGLSRSSQPISGRPGRRFHGRKPRSACSPNWPIHASSPT